MTAYEENARQGLRNWQIQMGRKPTISNRIANNIQHKINGFIPEKVHTAITVAIKNMVKAVLTGSEFISSDPLDLGSLEERESHVYKRINTYKKVAAASGFGIGAGGLLLSLADLPVLLSIKMKMLFDIAGLYGYDVTDYHERLYILHIFQVAFSSREAGLLSYELLLHWEHHRLNLPAHINDFDWRTFQQEYRDYIDLAKLLQLIPGIGAVVGAYANHQLVEKLGETAINAYRMRLFDTKLINE